MNASNYDYTLAFIILVCPVGSNNLLDVNIFAPCNDKDMTETLSIKNSLNIPNNSDIFESYLNYININQTGHYQFTVSDYLKGLQILIILKLL